MSKGRIDRSAGFLEGAGVDPQRNYPVAGSDELMSACSEALPVTREGNEEIVEDGLRAL